MVFLGAIPGLLFGLFSGFFLIGAIFPLATVFGLLAPVFSVVAGLASVFTGLPWIVSFLLWYAFNVAIFWLLAIPTQASVVFPAMGTRVPVTNWQNFYRGFGFGTATLVNMAILLPFFADPVLFIFGWASLVPILALITPVRFSTFFQGVVGWMGWVLPVHWPGNLIAFVLFVVMTPFGIASFGLGCIRFDITSGTLELRAPLGSVTAFNIANFSFLNGSNPTITQGPFLGAGTSSHEVGHNINSTAMTPFYSVATALEESRVFGTASVMAIGQMTAESRGAPQANRMYSPIWSA